jgi:putative transposase
MSIKAYKYRIYANTTTTKKLRWVLDRCRELYNAALSERKETYILHSRQTIYRNEQGQCIVVMMEAPISLKSISYYDQQNDLPEIKEIRPEYKEIGAHVLQDVVRRVEKAFDAFFQRVQNGEKPGYPRFKGRNRYNSFTYPDYAGWKLEGNRLRLSKIGTVKVKLHREMQGTIKTLTIKREGEHWYAVFSCEVKTEKLPLSYEDVGIDLGITHFAALSNGEFIDNPRYLRYAEKKLAEAQQALSRKQRGSHRRAKAVQRVARYHRKIRNQRRDFHHKVSHKLVNRYQMIVFEELHTANMIRRPEPKQDENGQYLPNGAAAKAGLNKSILDAGWATFIEIVSVKAASAGRTVLFVNPFQTSQICSGCGTIVKKDLSERWHSCACGAELDRDTNAAINILRLGYRQLSGGARPTSENGVEAFTF